MPTTLGDLSPGRSGRVARLTGQGPVKRRLADLGFSPGVEVLVRKVAPLGDPIEVRLRGFDLSLRRADACRILLEDGGL